MFHTSLTRRAGTWDCGRRVSISSYTASNMFYNLLSHLFRMNHDWPLGMIPIASREPTGTIRLATDNLQSLQSHRPAILAAISSFAVLHGHAASFQALKPHLSPDSPRGSIPSDGSSYL